MGDRKKRVFKGKRREGKDETITFKLNPNGPLHEQEAWQIFSDRLAAARAIDPLDRGATRRIMCEAILGLKGRRIPSAKDVRSNLSTIMAKLDEKIEIFSELLTQMQESGVVIPQPSLPDNIQERKGRISMSYLENLRQALDGENDENEEDF